MLTRRVAVVWLFSFGAALSLFLSACSSSNHASGEKALAVANAFFEVIRARDFERALAFYDPGFFEVEPRASRLAYLQNVAETLGSLKQVTMSESQINTIYSGRQYLYVFVNQYERGNATETVTLMQPIGKEQILIVSHKIESLLLSDKAKS